MQGCGVLDAWCTPPSPLMLCDRWCERLTMTWRVMLGIKLPFSLLSLSRCACRLCIPAAELDSLSLSGLFGLRKRQSNGTQRQANDKRQRKEKKNSGSKITRQRAKSLLQSEYQKSRRRANEQATSRRSFPQAYPVQIQALQSSSQFSHFCLQRKRTNEKFCSAAPAAAPEVRPPCVPVDQMERPSASDRSADELGD